MKSRWQHRYEQLYHNRFGLFLGSLLMILFGSLLVPLPFYENVFSPFLFLLNVVFGILLISRNRFLVWFFSGLLLLVAIALGGDQVGADFFLWGKGKYLQFVSYFIFYATVTFQIIRQVWRASEVNQNVILGLMSGYISIGLVAFFLFYTVEHLQPGSLAGLPVLDDTGRIHIDALLYYSYITLLTIGYGDIHPVGAVAQKASVLVGLLGQFYLVIITAVVVGKYMRFKDREDE